MQSLREKLTLLIEQNQKFQFELSGQLEKIQEAQQHNTSLQRRVRIYLAQIHAQQQKQPLASTSVLGDLVISNHDSTLSTTSRPSNSKKYAHILQKRLASQYFFVDPRDGTQPPENEDALFKIPHQQKTPLVFKSKKWSTSEMSNLVHGVVSLIREHLTIQLIKESAAIMKENVNEDEQLRKEKLLQHKNKIAQIQQLSDEQIEDNYRDSVVLNWEKVAQVFVPTRTAYECRKQYENEISVNRKSWTKEEEKKLVLLAQEYKGHHWEYIASQFEGRTAFQCFKRYQRSFNVNMLRSKWSKEEDDRLREAVKQYGERNWQQVANCLAGRTGQQCLHRWMKTLNPKIKRGRWTAEEDKRLYMACHAYQLNNWIKVQQHIPGRTDVQCRERWCNILNPELKNGPWTAEEDEKLRNAIDKFGVGKWARIAELCFPRTDNQCWRRWKVLTNAEDVESYKNLIKKRDNIMVRNFVGREKERPQLTASDLNSIANDNNTMEELQQQQQQQQEKDQLDGDAVLLMTGKRKRGRPPKRLKLLQQRAQQLAQLSNTNSKDSTTMATLSSLHMASIEKVYPMFIGIEPSPLVKASLNNIKNMCLLSPISDATLLEMKEGKPNFKLVPPIVLQNTAAGYVNLFALPYSYIATHALSTLHFLQEMDTNRHDDDNFVDPLEQFDDIDFCDDIDVDKFNEIRNVKEESTLSSSQLNVQTIVSEPSHMVLQHLEKSEFENQEYKLFCSVFDSIFSYSLHKVMASTDQLLPGLRLEIENKSVQQVPEKKEEAEDSATQPLEASESSSNTVTDMEEQTNVTPPTEPTKRKRGRPKKTTASEPKKNTQNKRRKVVEKVLQEEEQ